MRSCAKLRHDSRNNCSSSDKTVRGMLIFNVHGDVGSDPIGPRMGKSGIIAAIRTVYNELSMQPHTHADRHDHQGSLKTALIITSVFLVAEFVGALYTNSLALLADAGHMLTDVAALSLSFFAMRFATPRMTYGFYRVEILAALLNGVFLVLVALYIFYEGYHRFINPPAVKADWMLAVAILGLLANIASAWILFGKHHTSLNVRGAFFHVLTDAIGSVGAILASIAIIVSGYQVADPLISIVVAVLILWSSWILIRDAVDILLEGTPAHINIVSLRE